MRGTGGLGGNFRNPLHPYTKALLKAIPIADTSLRGQKREILHGEVVSPINPKPRCPYASEKCLAGDLTIREVEPNHYVSCALFDK